MTVFAGTCIVVSSSLWRENAIFSSWVHGFSLTPLLSVQVQLLVLLLVPLVHMKVNDGGIGEGGGEGGRGEWRGGE